MLWTSTSRENQEVQRKFAQKHNLKSEPGLESELALAKSTKLGIWSVRFFLQIGLGGLQGDDKTRNNQVDVNRWIISADNLLHHSFSSCFAFNVDGGVRSIIVSVKGRKTLLSHLRGKKHGAKLCDVSDDANDEFGHEEIVQDWERMKEDKEPSSDLRYLLKRKRESV